MKKIDLDSLKRMVMAQPSWQAQISLSRQDVLNWIDDHKKDREEIEKLREQINQSGLGDSK